MLFNSLDFAWFLPLALLLYWSANRFFPRHAHAVLLLLSYYFYGYWNVKFLLLIVASTAVDYISGWAIYSGLGKRKAWLMSSIIFNLAVLMVFKYFGFFVAEFTGAFSLLGYDLGIVAPNIVLPVGISFYTFQTMSYTIDVYRGKVEYESNFLRFATYVAFFPQLVAGPIEKASSLLPQFRTKKILGEVKWRLAVSMIAVGLFKKVVIADNAAVYADRIFGNVEASSTIDLWLGALYFAFQIYGDFSGYTDVAMGVALLFGIRLSVNFKYPYLSRDIAEFWRRWHVSLSSWFKEYVYFPLGGSKGGILTTLRNVFIVFLVSGIWHGANWTFLYWGFLNGLYIAPLVILGLNRANISFEKHRNLSSGLVDVGKMVFTFFLTLNAWVVFRSDSMSDAWVYFEGMYSTGLDWSSVTSLDPIMLSLMILLTLWEYSRRNDDFLIGEPKFSSGRLFNRDNLLVVALLWAVILMRPVESLSFVYFQF